MESATWVQILDETAFNFVLMPQGKLWIHRILIIAQRLGLRGRSFRAFVWPFLSPVVGSHSVDRFTSRRFCRVCLSTGEFLRPQGAILPGFYHLRGVGLLPGAWGAPQKGMPTGSKVFLALPDACGLRSCDRTHLKNGLVPYSCVGGTHRWIIEVGYIHTHKFFLVLFMFIYPSCWWEEGSL